VSGAAFRTAVETLCRVQQGLAGDPDPAERAALLELLTETTALLAAVDRRRLPTLALAERVQRLEHQLADRDPGERREIVCSRLGISKSRYYQLRGESRTDWTAA